MEGDLSDLGDSDSEDENKPDGEPEPVPVETVVLATEFAAEPETSNASYYGIGAAAFSTIAAAAYLYRKRQQVKGESDSFHRV